MFLQKIFAHKIVILGDTGVGKSSFLNMLTGINALKVREGVNSETRHSVIQKHKLNKYFGQSLEEELILLDTSAPNESSALANSYHLIKIVN